MWETYATLMETGAGMACPNCALVVAAAAGGIASEQASRPSNQGTIGKSETQITLPNDYKISNNQFECAGATHNKILFAYTKEDRVQKVNTLIGGDDDAINNLIDSYSICGDLDSKQRASAFQLLETNLNTENFNTNIAKYNNKSQTQILAIISQSGRNETSYLNNVVTTIDNMRGNNNSKSQILDYINVKTDELLNDGTSMTLEKQRKLLFLTAYKNSYYFWN